jgi:predicted RNase H-like HicB family nuclease
MQHPMEVSRVSGDTKRARLFYRANCAGDGKMKYKVVLEQSEEGYAVSVPGLPGCHSQGATEPEALVNIADAIRDYRAVAEEESRGTPVT